MKYLSGRLKKRAMALKRYAWDNLGYNNRYNLVFNIHKEYGQ